MKLQDGRPTDLTGRLPKEIRVYDFLVYPQYILSES